MTNPTTSISLLLKSFAAKTQAAILRAVRLDELARTDTNEVERIARDIGLSTSELYSLSSKGETTIPLLSRRLVQFGLNENGVNNTYPKVIRDMHRVCGNCLSTGKCTRDFAKGNTLSKISAYCPNTYTLEALSQEPPVATRDS